MRRRLTHFLSEVTRGTSTLHRSPSLFSLSPSHYPSIRASVHSVFPPASNQIISILYNVYVRVRSFSFARAKRTFFHEAPSVRGRDSGKYDFLHSPEYPGREIPVFSVNYREWSTASDYISTKLHSSDFSTINMAQTYNQKRNVYSIDQILGHGKDEGKHFSIFRVFFACYLFFYFYFYFLLFIFYFFFSI